MAVVKGQHLRLFLDGLAIAAAQTCDVKIHLDVLEANTKDDTDDWGHFIGSNLSWEASTSGLVVIDEDAQDFTDLMDLIGETVVVEFGLAGSIQNRTNQETIMRGEAVITDVNINASNRANSTFTCVMTGVKNLLAPLAHLCSSEPYRLVTSNSKALVVEDIPA